MSGRVGDRFKAVVTDFDERGARIQLEDMPVVARVDAHRIDPGDVVEVELTEADPARRSIRFKRVG